MGYDARWTPSIGGSELTARVLFGEPTKDDRLGEYGDNYTLRTFFMEYYQGDFPNLFEAVRDDKKELVYITIDDIERVFYVSHEGAKYDGRNYRVELTDETP